MADSHRQSQHLLPDSSRSDSPAPELTSPEHEGPAAFWSPLGRHPSVDRGYLHESPHDPASQPAIGLGITSHAPSTTPSATPSRDASPAPPPVGSTTREPMPSGPDDDVGARHASQATLVSPVMRCPTQKGIQQRRLSWVPLTILTLAVYATIVSGIYLVIALVRPRYGRAIGEDGAVVPATATLLSALFAKTVELSYVTVCVAFLGQVLSRRALTQGSRGITISDMSMRSWIMQPGALIVHWETLRYSAATVLGAITLTATVVAMLYTTAAEALVSPKLRMGPMQQRLLAGNVSTTFANPFYLADNCPALIHKDQDPDYQGTTCLDMQHVGQAYHNYQMYLGEWGERSSTSTAPRPLPTGSLHDNTTLTGSWIEQTNLTELSKKHGRLVNNVTAAMPHGGILSVTAYAANKLPDPQSLSGEGNFDLEASVLAPAVNVLCVGMNKSELSPLVYTEWPDIGDKFDAVKWTNDPPDNIPVYPSWLNRTVVDDLFGWGPKYGQRPPVFGKLPRPYNTLLNTTGRYPADSIYLLGATAADSNPPYVLCSLKAKQSPRCTTQYNATASGSQLSTRCEDSNNPLQLDHRRPSTPDAQWEPDWKNIASEWATSLSLGTGITDSRASNARLLMQLVPTEMKLDPTLPSVAEALAVMAGSTLIMSSTSAPFEPGWNSTEASLATPVPQSFSARVRSIGYASGSSQRWQEVFYVILIFAFITSAICLAFMLFEVRGRQVTDFTDPQNLFTLAMNSPATPRLQGACGAGPQGPQLKERWVVAMEEDHEHYYLRTPGEDPLGPPKRSATAVSMASMEVEDPKAISPAMNEYRQLSTQRSFLSRFY
ncbi:uncharacterized protein KD926_001743 [Aspergillus affinis]|uniref:uncharacterized protein n=1 Tax=Aspergillus affinis TaxID=1070780 RepID=UPI0022FDE8AF|nr:uncharacterized protein KD926_001743 [Aspergillus affinis]KAI9036532.1 hypothetical protein KD926_001743 [Aspergillus affinis]